MRKIEKEIEKLEKALKQEPDNQEIKFKLADKYFKLAMSMRKFSKLHSDRYYVPNEKDAKNYHKYLLRAHELDKESSTFSIALKYAKQRLKRHWDWNYHRVEGGFFFAFVAPLLILAISIGLFYTKSIFAIIFALVILVLYISSKYVPGWEIDKRDLKDEELIVKYMEDNDE